MAREVATQRKAFNTAVAWGIGLLIFFPILWTILTSFKTEAQAINDPPLFLMFDWTLENYAVVQERSDYMRFLWNSIIIAGGSTLLGVIIACFAFSWRNRIRGFSVADVLCLATPVGLLLGRILSLQVLDTERGRQFLKNQGDRRAVRTAEIPAYRGVITDRRGEPHVAVEIACGGEARGQQSVLVRGRHVRDRRVQRRHQPVVEQCWRFMRHASHLQARCR